MLATASAPTSLEPMNPSAQLARRVSFLPFPVFNHSIQSQYVYTPLRDTSVDAQDQFNFFGVIIDAAYPYKTP